MVCNIAQPLKNANGENKKRKKRTMGSVDVADFFAALPEDGFSGRTIEGRETMSAVIRCCGNRREHVSDTGTAESHDCGQTDGENNRGR